MNPPGAAGGLLRRAAERATVLDRRPRLRHAFLAALPAALARRFDAGAAGELEAVLQLEVLDPRGGSPAPFALSIRGGTCRVTAGGAETAAAVVGVGAGDMVRLVSGAVGWPELMADGRLALAGDPFLALRFPALFGLPPG